MDTELLDLPALALDLGLEDGPEPVPEGGGMPSADASPEGTDDARVASLEAALTQAEAARASAVARLRAALLASEPAIPGELVAGDSAEELEESFMAARALVARVREAVALAAPVVPAGAPGRSDHAAGSPSRRSGPDWAASTST